MVRRPAEDLLDVDRLVVGEPERAVDRFSHAHPRYKPGMDGPRIALIFVFRSARLFFMASKARRKTQMSDDHKAALAVGRTEGRVVRRYLDALEANKPKRGRKRTPDSIQRRLKAIDAELAETDKLNELKLVQERMNLETRAGLARRPPGPGRPRGRVHQGGQAV